MTAHPSMPDLNALPLPALYRELMRNGVSARLFELAREEDLGPDGVDLTTDAVTGPNETGEAAFTPREAGVLAGLAAMPMIADVLAPSCAIQPAAQDGDGCEPGRPVATVRGPLREILRFERTALNVMSRLSGVATLAARYVRQAASSGVDPIPKVCDTRKTTPGWRALEKYAVRCGGGWMHRIGLHDAVLIKDNHLRSAPVASLAGRVREAVERARGRTALRFVEVEVDTLEQLDALLAIEPGVIDIILLDNMSNDELRDAVQRRRSRSPSVLLEASGGVTLETIAEIARTGVDRISVGAMTHAARSLDIGLDLLS